LASSGGPPLLGHAVVPSGFRLQVNPMAQERPSGFLLAAPGIQHRVTRRTLSPHPAFQGPAFLARHCHRVRIPFQFTLHLPALPGGLQRVSIYSGSPSLCRPSPCGRLSRPRTTMAAPTLLRFPRPTAGLRPQEQSPTFTMMDSAKEFRRRLSLQPNRSLRLPTRKQVRSGYLLLSLGWKHELSSLEYVRDTLMP